MNTYQLKITLNGIEPPIWRRIEIDGDAMLSEVHDAFQCVLGWDDNHMHAFVVGKKKYGPYGEEGHGDMLDEDDIVLNDFAEKGSHFEYRYDFGEGWVFDVVVESVLTMSAGNTAPRCLEGARACPPEDCGGIPGYLEKLTALKDPSHPDHDGVTDWFTADFDPEAFSVDEANLALADFAEGEARLIQQLIDEGLLPPDEEDGESDDGSAEDSFEDMMDENPMLEEMLQRFLAKLRADWGAKSEEDVLERMNSLTPKDLQDLQKRLIEDDPIEMAQNIALTALSEDDADDAIPIAEQALQLDPKNIDARLLVTLCKDKPDVELLVSTRNLVTEAERALGADTLQAFHGRLSECVFARPYIRAVSALVSMLAKTTHTDEAITLCERIVALDQLDLANVRPRLAILLLTSRQLPRAAQVLSECDGENEVVLWGRVLERHLAGDLKGAEKALRTARKHNPDVAKFLFTNATFEDIAEDMTDTEYSAWISADFLGSAWRGSPKSIQWLREKTS